LPTVLLCGAQSLEAELLGSAVMAPNVERYFAAKLEEALTMSVAARPALVLIDGELPRAEELIKALRRDASTRPQPVSFAVDALPSDGGAAAVPAMVLNLSATGMLLESSLSLGPGEAVGLEFSPPGAVAPVHVHGRVVRLASSTQFGIEFLRFEGEGCSALARFVEMQASL
jgi:hypothetical protein